MPKSPKAKVAFAVAATLPILALALAALAIQPLPGDETGTWVASAVQDCDNDLVCMEWDLRFGESEEPACCRDASHLGSTVYSVCTGPGSHFRH